METKHLAVGSFENEFPAICNYCVIMTYDGLKSQNLEIL